MVCDSVLMAVPFEEVDISLPSDISERINVGREYRKTIATIAKGKLNTDTFATNAPCAIYTTNGVNDCFFSGANDVVGVGEYCGIHMDVEAGGSVLLVYHPL